jgi:hypothetical protein
VANQNDNDEGENNMTQYIQFSTADGGLILVEVEAEEEKVVFVK